MSGEERRGKIIQALKNSDKAVSATTLAKEFDVSRQVIVQDVALLRANGLPQIFVGKWICRFIGLLMP